MPLSGDFHAHVSVALALTSRLDWAPPTADEPTLTAFPNPANLTQLRISLFVTTGYLFLRDSLGVLWESGRLSSLALDIMLDFRGSESIWLERTRAMLSMLRGAAMLVDDTKVALFVLRGQSFNAWMDIDEAKALFGLDVARLESHHGVACSWGAVKLDSVLRKPCGIPNTRDVNGWDW